MENTIKLSIVTPNGVIFEGNAKISVLKLNMSSTCCFSSSYVEVIEGNALPNNEPPELPPEEPPELPPEEPPELPPELPPEEPPELPPEETALYADDAKLLAVEVALLTA